MKYHFARSVVLAGCLAGLFSGCAHLMETRAIARFISAMEQDDLQRLRTASSSEFEKKALRRSEALADFRILRLPEGKISIVDVQDVSENEKTVTAEVGEREKKLRYRLLRDSESGKWVVDDILVTQKHGGVVATKSVTEQMDLFLTIREFLETWHRGASRAEVLDVTTEPLGKILEDLPPAYLARLTARVASDPVRGTAFQPVARMDRDVALVELPRSTGRMILSMRLVEDRWKVDDIAVQGADEDTHIPSVKKMASALNAAAGFLDAYEIANRAELEKHCTPKFYRSSLQFANLSSVSLPGSTLNGVDYDIVLRDERADFELDGVGEIVKIGLVRKEAADADADSSPEFLVEDVTIFDLNEMQQKRLSALFTAQAVTQIFAEALSERNLQMLQQTSTRDMNDRVWSRLQNADFTRLPLPEYDTSIPEVETMEFHGASIKIHARRHGQKLVYHLRDRDGDVRVDDVVISRPGRPESFKTTMDLLVPIRTFAQAVSAADIGAVQRRSSRRFNNLVWKHVPEIPGPAYAAVPYLQTPMTSVDSDKGETVVTLGDGHSGAQVTLTREYDHYVVDEVQIIAGPQPEQRMALKEELRRMVAEGVAFLDRNSGRVSANGVTTAGYSVPATGTQSKVRFAAEPGETRESESGASAADLDAPYARHPLQDVAEESAASAQALQPAGATFDDVGLPAQRR